MISYIARRLVQAAGVFFGVSVILFACLFVVPGDPVEGLAGEGQRLDEATRARLHERYHLDDPLPAQYVRWLGGVVTGDLGESYRFRRPVTEVLGEKLGNSFDLALAAFGIQAVIGVTVGVVAAAFRRSFLDTLVYVGTILALGVPAFVVALALQHAFAVRLGWFPLHGQGGLRSLVLPALSIAAIDIAGTARLMRANLLQVLDSDYVRTAWAKGLPRRTVIGKHALRNAAGPVLTTLGVHLGAFLGGAAIVETIFNWDGLGRVMVTAIAAQDNPIVVGVVVYSVVGFVVANLLVDLAYAALDPRVRLEGGAR